jgi:hypothetical protein
MRDRITLSMEEEIITTLKKRAVKKHTSASKIAEDLLRKAFRL